MQIGPYRVSETAGDPAGAPLQAQDPAGHQVELRLLPAPDAALRQRCLRAAAALQGLKHPGLQRLLDHGQHQDQVYLVSEVAADEQTLGDRLVEGGALEPLRAARIVLRLAETLEDLHRRGLCHGDLRPANVRLRAGDRPLLGGFDLADQRGAARGPGLGFLAPERASAEPEDLGPAADVYGLGAVLYALLTGEPPLQEPSRAALLDAIAVARPRAPSELVPGELDKRLETVCLRCLEKYPARRPPSAAAVASALREVLGIAPSPRRAPWLLAGALLLVGALTAGGIVLSGRPGGATPVAAPSPPPPAPSPPASPPPRSPPAAAEPADADTARARLQRARARARAQAWAEALAELDGALQRDPDLVEARTLRVWALEAAGADAERLGPAVDAALQALGPHDPARPPLVALDAWLGLEPLRERFRAQVLVPDREADLAGAALVVAGLVESGLDASAGQARLKQLAAELGPRLTPASTDAERLDALGQLLDGAGLQATPAEEPRACSLHQALGGAPALPTTLAIVALGVAQRAGLPLAAWSQGARDLVGDPQGRWFLEPAEGWRLYDRAALASRGPEPHRQDRALILIRLLSHLLVASEDRPQLRLLRAGTLELALVLGPDQQLLWIKRAEVADQLGLPERAARAILKALRLEDERGAGTQLLEHLLTGLQAKVAARWADQASPR